MFRLEQVGFRVGTTPLLQPLNLTFERGHVYGLIGHNGSGKSTLLKLLARQQQASCGQILLDDRPLRSWSARALARQVAYLPQQIPLAEGLTVHELVMLGRYPWRGLLGRTRTADRQIVAQALARTDTARLAAQPFATLSGGERQRAWLAMLLAQDSRFLLLDEPLAALDIAHQVEVMALIRQLSAELGLGVILVLHDINIAARYCDRLIALRQGRLIADSAPRALMTSDQLQRIYALEMPVIPHPATHHPVALLP